MRKRKRMHGGVLKLFAILMISLAPGRWAAANAVPDTLQLDVNEERRITFPEDVRSADRSDGTVVQLQGEGTRDLRVRGLKEGDARIDYVLRNGTRGSIAVSVGKIDQRLLDIKEWLDHRLRGVVGIENVIRENLKFVAIQGVVRSGEDYDRANRIYDVAKARYPRMVEKEFSIRIDTDMAEAVLKEYLQENGIVSPSVSVRDRMVRVSGLAYAQADSDRVTQGLPTVFERLRLGDVMLENTIRLDESIVEIELMYFQMSDGVVRELGVDLLNNIGLNVRGVGTFGDGAPQYSAVIDVQLSKVLNMLAEDGKVENIHSTTITTANGVEGSSQFGETVVLVKRGVDRDAVEEIEVGHILRVTPTLRSGNEVSLNLSGEVSEVGSIDKDGNVRVNRNAFNNTMNLPNNAGMVAAFHKGNRWISVRGGTPFLRRIPVINWVFGKYRMEKTEVYRGFVIVPRLQRQTMEVGPSVSDQTDAIIKRIRQRSQ